MDDGRYTAHRNARSNVQYWQYHHNKHTEDLNVNATTEHISGMDSMLNDK
jgi:hypothetical protein